MRAHGWKCIDYSPISFDVSLSFTMMGKARTPTRTYLLLSLFCQLRQVLQKKYFADNLIVHTFPQFNSITWKGTSLSRQIWQSSHSQLPAHYSLQLSEKITQFYPHDARIFSQFKRRRHPRKNRSWLSGETEENTLFLSTTIQPSYS